MDIAEKTLRLKQDFDDVYEAGKKAEYDEFWDLYQENGNRTGYNFAFRGAVGANAWTQKNFKPKYNINVVGDATQMFYNMGDKNDLLDMPKLLKEQGVTIDFSGATRMNLAFGYARISHLPVIDLMSCITSRALEETFFSRHLTTIDKIICYEMTQFFNTFREATRLENVIIEGVIGQAGFDIHWSTKLTHDSLMSIINALADKSGTGTTFTITLGTENLAKLTDAEKAIATQKGWSLA